MTKNKANEKIVANSTAEYFAKNLQQVGFSSPIKAVLTTVKEAMDNALDACEEHGILPNIRVDIKKLGLGSLKNTDRISIKVLDNGPGIEEKYVPMVFGQYLASSKFGQGRPSRGQQGIGISAATTWALQTSAIGAKVTTKRENERKALRCVVVTDLKKNEGILKDKEKINWENPHGTEVEFIIDGKIQMNGEGGLLTYLRGTILLNPHMTLTYHLTEMEPVTVERVIDEVPEIPKATPPHPHTMKLGEFLSYARLFSSHKNAEWLCKGFSRVSPNLAATLFKDSGLPKTLLDKKVNTLTSDQLKKLFQTIQDSEFQAPSTKSVMSLGEKALSLSVMRLGKVDYFSVVTRKPAICDFKPVQVEVAIARLFEKKSDGEDSSVQILRFANRVPLQFDKASCAIVKSISSVNWKSYSIKQTKGNLPSGPYIIAVSVVSPFLKFKNASKETIDATDELVTEIRKALMKAGQSLSRHIKKEAKTQELENKIKHIEKFGPVLVNTLCRILGASEAKKKKAEEGIEKILGRDNLKTRQQLDEVEERLNVHLASRKDQFDSFIKEDEELQARQEALLRAEEEILGTRYDDEETSSKKEFSRKKKSPKKK